MCVPRGAHTSLVVVTIDGTLSGDGSMPSRDVVASVTRIGEGAF